MPVYFPSSYGPKRVATPRKGKESCLVTFAGTLCAISDNLAVSSFARRTHVHLLFAATVGVWNVTGAAYQARNLKIRLRPADAAHTVTCFVHVSTGKEEE